MSFIPKPHEIYRHFKGNLYQITAIAEHTETGEQLVVYQAMYGEFKTYARPLAMFVEKIDKRKYPDASQDFRFELQGPDAGRQRAETEAEEQDTGLREERQKNEQAAVGPRGEKQETEMRKQEAGWAETVGQEAAAWEEPAEEELALDPLVLEFLDSDSYEQRLNILAGLHHRITDDMITTMAIACDIEINDGDIEERYEALRVCLLTLERYECNRLR